MRVRIEVEWPVEGSKDQLIEFSTDIDGIELMVPLREAGTKVLARVVTQVIESLADMEEYGPKLEPPKKTEAPAVFGGGTLRISPTTALSSKTIGAPVVGATWTATNTTGATVAPGEIVTMSDTFLPSHELDNDIAPKQLKSGRKKKLS